MKVKYLYYIYGEGREKQKGWDKERGKEEREKTMWIKLIKISRE